MELYIHIPFCVRKCLYCDFLSGAYDKDTRDKYTNKICEEIAYFGKGMPGSTLSSIYIGGGTPSWLELASMDRICETVYDYFHVEDDAEVTIECNPGTATKDAFKKYRDMGINRMSIGLQSANDEELKLLGRIHDFNQFLRTYEYAREA
nr:radical SAM protein [Lachnospiraceae bacterium]